MEMSENIRTLRKARGMTQEQLAERLGVSRQAVSKWEAGVGYPETEKLLLLARALETSIDALMGAAPPEVPAAQPAGSIAVTAFDGRQVVQCRSVRVDDILAPGKNEPRCILSGVDRTTLLGDHAVTLGFYATQEDAQREVEAIAAAMARGERAYTLRFAADIEFTPILGQPRLRRE